jgi:type III secretion system needle length determinant
MNTSIKDTGFVAQQEPTAAKTEPGVAEEAAQQEFDHLLHRKEGLPAGAEPDVAEAATRKEFDRLSYRTEKHDEGSEARLGKPQDKQKESLSSLISSLFGERLGVTPGSVQVMLANTTVAPATVDAPRTTEMVERLVAQILVSPPDSAGEQEVRLMVKDSLLPDTEIRLARGADGLLSVTLSTGRSEVFQTLVAAQADLKQALDAREKQEVRLVVMDTQKSGAEDENGGRRSRGYGAYAPDDGEAG